MQGISQFYMCLTGIVVRQIADLLSLMQDLHQIPSLLTHLDVTQDDVANVQVIETFQLACER